MYWVEICWKMTRMDNIYSVMLRKELKLNLRLTSFASNLISYQTVSHSRFHEDPRGCEGVKVDASQAVGGNLEERE